MIRLPRFIDPHWIHDSAVAARLPAEARVGTKNSTQPPSAKPGQGSFPSAKSSPALSRLREITFDGLRMPFRDTFLRKPAPLSFLEFNLMVI
jgi:hypothetical protein